MNERLGGCYQDTILRGLYASINHYWAHQTLPTRSRRHGDDSGE